MVISGNRPAPSDYSKYPAWIFFDGRPDEIYTTEQLDRVALVSDSFDSYSKWNGKGYPVDAERNALRVAIDKVHSMGKPIRFWGTPDGMTAWNTLHSMGVDIINTDHPEACSSFFRGFDNKNFSITSGGLTPSDATARPRLLDRATRSFEGFDADSRSLSGPVAVYAPTYRDDGENVPVKNAILMIGDGMGLAALQAAETVNGELTMTKMEHVGLQRTHAAEEFTTDSAGAGSSIATGKPNRNRHISMSPTGERGFCTLPVPL